jgi:hypothetical protein
MNFDDVWGALNNSVPPEITHYQHQQHPGKDWWLKTAVFAGISEPPLLRVWHTLQNQHPQLIKITPTAYDWQGALIENTHTVWIANNRDVRLSYHCPDFAYEIVDQDISSNQWGVHLEHALREYAESKNLDQLIEHDWHNLLHVAEFISSWCTDHQARIKRKGMHIVSNSSSDQSTANHGSELDPI